MRLVHWLLNHLLITLCHVSLAAPNEIQTCLRSQRYNTTCRTVRLPKSLLRPRMFLPRTDRDCTLPCTESPLARRILQHPQRVCAWLERGGIFNTPKVPRPGKPLLYRRMKCLPDPSSSAKPCRFQWATLDNPRAVTFKWIGTDDIRQYEMQLHTCGDLYPRSNPPPCRGSHDETAFELQQRGTLLFLSDFHCVCNRAAEISEVVYQRPTSPAKRSIHPRFIRMTCYSPPVCSDLDDPCFYEAVNARGQVTGGFLGCQCPKRFFCDIYHMRRPRELAVTATGHTIYLTYCQLAIWT